MPDELTAVYQWTATGCAFTTNRLDGKIPTEAHHAAVIKHITSGKVLSVKVSGDNVHVVVDAKSVDDFLEDDDCVVGGEWHNEHTHTPR